MVNYKFNNEKIKEIYKEYEKGLSTRQLGLVLEFFGRFLQEEQSQSVISFDSPCLSLLL